MKFNWPTYLQPFPSPPNSDPIFKQTAPIVAQHVYVFWQIVFTTVSVALCCGSASFWSGSDLLQCRSGSGSCPPILHILSHIFCCDFYALQCQFTLFYDYLSCHLSASKVSWFSIFWTVRLQRIRIHPDPSRHALDADSDPNDDPNGSRFGSTGIVEGTSVVSFTRQLPRAVTRAAR
jgi:hypothetical protein